LNPSTGAESLSSSFGSQVLSSGFLDISRLKRNKSTVRMSYKWMKISIRKSMNKKLGISLSFSLSIDETLGGKVSSSGMEVGSVERGNSSVPMLN